MKIDDKTQAHDVTILFDGNFAELLDYLNSKQIGHKFMNGLSGSKNFLTIERESPKDPKDDPNYCGAV